MHRNGNERVYYVIYILSALLLSVDAFVPLGSFPKSATTSKSSSSRQYVIPVESTQDLSHVVDPAFVTYVSHLVSDASSTAAATSSQQPTGLWGSYINLFKSSLNLVHSVIDQPLRNVGVTQTWGVSIALFTSFTRAILLPLSIQQSKSAEYMKLLKPYVSEIKARYKDNEEAQNRAVGKLYEDANQNPLSGCLLSLAQIPIFLGLYRGIRLLALDGALEEPFLFIPSLEGPVSPPDYRGLDWLIQGWSTIDGTLTPSLGWETTLAFLIMPVLLVVLQSFTMSALQPPIDEEATAEERKQQESTQNVLRFLPLMIGFFSLQVPAGLTIYWLSSNLFTLSQSLGVKAYFAANPPEIQLPEYWEQMNEKKDFKEMTPEERRKATEAGLSVGPSFEDLVTEAKFHVYVERQPFRETTEAWKRVASSSSSSSTVTNGIHIPSAMQEWVASSSPKVEVTAAAGAKDGNGATDAAKNGAEISGKTATAVEEKTESTAANIQLSFAQELTSGIEF